MRLLLRKLIYYFSCLLNAVIPKDKNRVLFCDAAFRQESSWALMEFLSGSGGAKATYYSNRSKPSGLPSGIKWESSPAGAFLSFLRSGFVFYTHSQLRPFIKPSKRQQVINLWHGTPLKAVTFPDSAIPQRCAFTKVLSASPEVDGLMRRMFGCSQEQVLTMGYPRNDWLFTDKDVFSSLGIDSTKYSKIAVWMPTFRKASSLGRIDSDREFPVLDADNAEKLDSALRDMGILLIIKPHPAADTMRLFKTAPTNIITITNDDLSSAGIQAYELLGRSDMLLTDYSSVYFDYLITEKPILFVFDDLEAYGDKLGFFFDDPLSVMPGPKACSVDELIENLAFQLKNGTDVYFGERVKMKRRFNMYSDGDNSLRLLMYLGIIK